MKRFVHAVIFACISCVLSAQTLPDTAHLMLWLRADSGVTLLTAGGDSVATWTDWSGHGNSTTGPAAADSMPILIAHDSILNNLPSISFNSSLSSNRQEFYGTTINNLGASSLTIFIVSAGYKTSNSDYTNGMFNVGTEATGMWLYRRTQSPYGSGDYYFLNNASSDGYNGAASLGAMPNAGYKYAIWGMQKILNTSVTMYTNNNVDQTVTGDPIMSGPFQNANYLIANSHNAGAPWQNLNGKIAEIIVYTTALDSIDMQTVRNYLYNKYAPPISLGPDTVSTSLCPVIVSVGNRFLSYHWSTGDSVHEQIAVTRTGTYSVTVTDVFGRTTSGSIHVTVPFIGTSPVDTALCFGQSAAVNQLLINPQSYTYSWNTSATTSSITVSTPGKYACIISDGTCQIYDTIKVTVDSLSLLTLLPAIPHICGGTSPAINDAGYEVVSYLWSPGGDTVAAPALETPGTYTLSVTDVNGCSATGSSQVTLYGHTPLVHISVANVCYTFPTNFTVFDTALNNDPIDSVFWVFPNANPGSSNALVTISTIYATPGLAKAFLTVKSDSGCVTSIEDSFLIHQNPEAQFSGAPGCTSNSYQFINQSTSPPGDNFSAWLWNFGDGSTDTSQNPLHQYANNGSYNVSLTATDSAGCSNTITLRISLSVIIQLVPATPVLPGNNAAFQNDTVFFAWNTVPGATGYSIEIDSNPQFSSAWLYSNLTGTNYTAILPCGTKYYWLIIANNLCDSNAFSQVDTFSIFNPNMAQCLVLWLRGDSVKLVSGGDSIATWWDKSGNGNSTTGPAYIDSMPTWIAHDPILNNMPTVNFNPGATDYQEFYGDVIPNLDMSSLTTFIVAAGYQANTQAYADGMFGIGGLTSGMYVYRRIDLQTYMYINSGALLEEGPNSMPPSGFPYALWGMEKTYAQNVSLYTNGDLVADTNDPTATGDFAPGPYVIANSHNGGLTFENLRGKIAEVLIYNCALSDEQRQQVQNYIYTRYAPPVYLGSDVVLHNLCPYTLDAGNHFVSYAWSTGDSIDSVISVTRNGNYSVTVTDVFGHTSSSSINVSFPFEGTSPVDTTICLGQSAVLKQLLNNPSSYTYSWNTGATVDSIIVNSPGIYTCNIFDGTCHLLDAIQVKVDSFSLVQLFPADTLICGASSPAVNLGGDTAVSYLWAPGGSTSTTPEFDSAGTYYVTVTDSHGCTANDSTTLSFHGHAPFVNFNAAGFCYGSSTSFTSLDSAFGTDNVDSLIWHFRGFNPPSSNAPDTAITYTSVGQQIITLSVFTDSGCTASKADTIFINQSPTSAFSYTGTNSNLSAAYVLCAGSTSYLQLTNQSVAGFSSDSLISAVWAINGVIDPSTLSDNTILYPLPVAGTYNIMLAVENEMGCTDTSIQQVQVFPPFTANFSFSNICLTETTQFIDLTHSYSTVAWDWNFGDGSEDNPSENPSHLYTTPGLYVVTLKDTNAIGCVSIATKFVTIVDTPSADFTGNFACQQEIYAPLDSSTCGLGDTIVQWNWLINGSSYNTQNPEQFMSENISSFQAKLVITTEDGCTDSITKTVSVYPSPRASFSYTPQYGTAPITINFANQSVGAVGYTWDFGDNSGISTQPAPSHEYPENGTYQIVLYAINSYGCTDTSSSFLTLVPTELDIAVDKVYATEATQPDGTVLIEVTALICNDLTRPIISAQFKVNLGSGGTYIQNWSGYLGPGECMLDTIPVNFDVDAGNAQSSICVVAQDVNGGQTETTYANNEICISLTGTMQLAGPSPNPAINESTLGIIMPDAGQVTIDIIDALGQYVMKNTLLNLPAGRSDYLLPVPQLNGAEYYIRITYNGDVQVRKLMTQ